MPYPATVSFPCFLTHGGHAAVVVVALRTGANAALLDALQHFCGLNAEEKCDIVCRKDGKHIGKLGNI